MGFISSIPSLSSVYTAIKFVVIKIVTSLPTTQAVKEFAETYFTTIRQSCFCVIGLDEFVRKGVLLQTEIINVTERHPIAIKVHTTFFEKLKHRLKEAESYIIRGGLFIGSGGFGIFSDMYRQSGNAGHHLHFLFNTLANGLFLAANLVTLEFSVQQLNQAQDILRTSSDPKLLNGARKACDSAILGLISSVHYIVAAAMFLLDLSTLIAFVVGCIGTATAFLKALYDWYYTAPQLVVPGHDL